MAAIFSRSFTASPPTHEARITVRSSIDDKELSAALGRFCRRLRYRACEYLCVNEWRHGRRHLHIVIRTGAKITPSDISAWWDKSLPGVPFTHHLDTVRCAGALAKYLVKHLRSAEKKELVPSVFTGRVVTYSRHFLIKRLADIWADQLAAWYPSQAQAAPP
jgi:hypothetical protein